MCSMQPASLHAKQTYWPLSSNCTFWIWSVWWWNWKWLLAVWIWLLFLYHVICGFGVPATLHLSTQSSPSDCTTNVGNASGKYGARSSPRSIRCAKTPKWILWLDLTGVSTHISRWYLTERPRSRSRKREDTKEYLTWSRFMTYLKESCFLVVMCKM